MSRWHTVAAVEFYLHHAGAPLELSLPEQGTEAELIILGSDLAAGQRPLGIVPAHAWQSARTLGDWYLVGCTVAPVSNFDGFNMAPEGWSPGQTNTWEAEMLLTGKFS